MLVNWSQYNWTLNKQNKTNKSLFDVLPQDVLSLISHNLDYISFQNFRKTCRFFYCADKIKNNWFAYQMCIAKDKQKLINYAVMHDDPNFISFVLNRVARDVVLEPILVGRHFKKSAYLFKLSNFKTRIDDHINIAVNAAVISDNIALFTIWQELYKPSMEDIFNSCVNISSLECFQLFIKENKYSKFWHTRSIVSGLTPLDNLIDISLREHIPNLSQKLKLMLKDGCASTNNIVETLHVCCSGEEAYPEIFKYFFSKYAAINKLGGKPAYSIYSEVREILHHRHFSKSIIKTILNIYPSFNTFWSPSAVISYICNFNIQDNTNYKFIKFLIINFENFSHFPENIHRLTSAVISRNDIELLSIMINRGLFDTFSLEKMPMQHTWINNQASQLLAHHCFDYK